MNVSPASSGKSLIKTSEVANLKVNFENKIGVETFWFSLIEIYFSLSQKCVAV